MDPKPKLGESLSACSSAAIPVSQKENRGGEVQGDDLGITRERRKESRKKRKEERNQEKWESQSNRKGNQIDEQANKSVGLRSPFLTEFYQGPVLP